MTISDYLIGKVAFSIDTNTIASLCLDRGVDCTKDQSILTSTQNELLYADMLSWAATKPDSYSGANHRHVNASITERGEGHSGQRRFKRMANAIYKKYGDSKYEPVPSIVNITHRW